MANKTRYDTNGLEEGSFEPGSHGRVLKNKLGIIRKREMDEVETREHFRTLNIFLETYDNKHRFTAKDICHMHKTWLENIYSWAGNYRQVNISKGGFTFAMAMQIPKLMEQFEQGPLSKYTPCFFDDNQTIIHAIAEVHVELILIHPFREGNGRLARMLSVIMGLQAGFPPLDFGIITGKNRRAYFAAVQAGMSYDYSPMETIFKKVVKRSFQLSRGG